MKALILVGGYGTRLRPLTLTRPKPLLEFGNVPLIFHQLEALSKAGVSQVILATGHLSKHIEDIIPLFKKNLNLDIIFTEENEPLGTAGPIALSKENLMSEGDEPFIVLNSDIICEFPLTEMLDFHIKSNSDATILTTPVEDPSRFGVVVLEKNSCFVDHFIEKPKDNVGNNINAGVYILKPNVISMIPLRACSIEREIFPALAAQKRLTAFSYNKFWADIGEPASFIRGTSMYLKSLKRRNLLPEIKRNSCEITGNVLLSPTCRIGSSCKLGPDVVIGDGVVIGNGVRILNSTIMSESVIDDHSYIDSSIVGNSCSIGKWAHICNVSVLGEKSTIFDEVHANYTYTLPNVSVSGNINVQSVASGPFVLQI